MIMEEKEKCDCGKMATWCYMPGYSSGESPYSCDDCVNRGCACNWNWLKEPNGHENTNFIADELPEGIEGKDWKWIIEDPNRSDTKGIKLEMVWTETDNYGREYPCVEYDYNENGWDIEKSPTQQSYESASKNNDVSIN